MMRCASNQIGRYGMLPFDPSMNIQTRIGGLSAKSIQQQNMLDSFHGTPMDAQKEDRALLGYRKFSPFRRIDWAKLTNDPHDLNNEKAIHALLEDLRDRKALFKIHKNKDFKKAVSLVKESISYTGKGIARAEKLEEAESYFEKAAMEFPYQYLKAESYQAAAIIAKILGKPVTPHLKLAKHYYENSGDEIQWILDENELNRFDTARIFIGFVPCITEWLLRMGIQPKPSLKPNQTLSARILMPISKMQSSFHAEEMENHRQNSDIPELCRQLISMPQVSAQSKTLNSDMQTLDFPA